MNPWLVGQAVERACAAWPEAVAVAGSEGERLRYGELERTSRGLARALGERGLTPGGRVGIWMRKTPAAVVAQLAALRAGGVYVPLDAAAPAARVAALAADCRLEALLADADLAAGALAWPHPPPAVMARGSQAWQAALADDGGLRPPERCSDDAAYILYTSGSTGAPKGVVLSHAHALQFMAWSGEAAGLEAGEAMASYAPFHFDLSIFDLWTGLSRGARVCLLDSVSARFPAAVAGFLDEHGIRVMYAVPSALVALLPQLTPAAAARLRALIFAGEVFPAPALRAWRRAAPQARFLNWYGPTETNVCAHYELPAAAEPAAALPLGEACPNFVFEILDEERRAVGAGEAGLLWVRGPGLLSGYWGEAQPDAIWLRANGGGPPQRLYNTGDVVRRDAGGRLHFEGRRDDMVKLRGYRISLLEVQRAVEAFAGVEQAAIVCRRRGDLAVELCGVLTLAEGAECDGGALRAHCAARLPAYMIPERFEVRDRLPVTSTGKTDRVRLQREMGVA